MSDIHGDQTSESPSVREFSSVRCLTTAIRESITELLTVRLASPKKVEIFLPLKLAGCNFEHWPLGKRGTLRGRFPVVLRSYDRLLNLLSIDAALKKWPPWCVTGSAFRWRNQPVPDDIFREFEQLSPAPCLIIPTPLSGDEASSLWDASIEAGVGVIVWIRSEAPVGRNWQGELTELFSNVQALPDTVHKAHHTHQHLVLHWDDPHQPPYIPERLTSPKNS